MINKILLKKHRSQFIMGGFFNSNEKNDSLINPVFLTTFKQYLNNVEKF